MLRLMTAAALVMLNGFASAEPVRVGGTGAALGVMRLQAAAFHATGTRAQVSVLQALGSAGAIRALVAGSIEVAVLSRPPTAQEKAHGLTTVEYATTPFVIATWPGNPAEGLTTVQLAEFYTAARPQWSDRTPVRIVLRPPGDTDTEIINSSRSGRTRAIC